MTNSPTSPAIEPAPEQDPGEQVEQAEGQRAGDDPGEAPGEGVRPGVDGGRRAGAVEDEELLAVLGRVVGVEVGAPRGRDEAGRELGIGEGRIAVRLDDIHRPRPAGRCARGEAQDVDHLTRLVVGDERSEAGQRVRAEAGRSAVHRSVLGHVAPDRDDVVVRILLRPERRIDPGLVEPIDHAEAMGSPGEHEGRDDRRTVGVDERDAVGGRDRDPFDLVDVDPRERPVGDGRVDGRPGVATPRVAEDDRRPGRRRVEPILEFSGAAGVEDVGQARGDGRVIGDVVHGGDQRRPAAAGRQVRDGREVE